MDSEKFDALSRRIGKGGSRRGVLKRLAQAGAAALALKAGVGQEGGAAARDCREYGCSCNAGVLRACRGELVCCPWSAGVPGGLGQCVTEDECFGPACVNMGGSCAPYCGWGAECPDCCSGFCGDFGVCDTPRCGGAGCACTTGTAIACDWGYSCCPLQPGLPGGPGVCSPDGSC